MSINTITFEPHLQDLSVVRYLNFAFTLLLCLIYPFATEAVAQQSLFNVPSSEITNQGKLFVQEQINISDLVQSNTTLDYGLKNNWEAGLNFFGVNYSPAQRAFIRNDDVEGDPYAPLVLINVQKGFVLNDHWKIGIGTQNGFNVAPEIYSRFADFSYADAVYSTLHEHLRLNAGLYAGNARYLGAGNNAGLMVGAEAALWQHKVHLMADWIQGDHDLGVSVFGVVAYPYRHFPISLGWQIPNDSASRKALVFELTWVP